MTASSRISVVVADDHPVYRSGLIRMLATRPEFQVVAELEDGRAALEAIARLRPDVAVLDIGMPRMAGIEVVRSLRTRDIPVPVLLLTGSAESHSLYEALAAGAAGYILKTAQPQDIVDAVAALARGEVRLPADMHAALAADIRAREHGAGRSVLADREREVLGLTADGLSAAEIAQHLHLGLPTIRSHLQNAYQKLEVSDRAAAVAKALRLGLID